MDTLLVPLEAAWNMQARTCYKNHPATRGVDLTTRVKYKAMCTPSGDLVYDSLAVADESVGEENSEEMNWVDIISRRIDRQNNSSLCFLTLLSCLFFCSCL